MVFFNYLVLSHRREHACNFFYQSVCQLLYHEHFTGQVSANQLVTVTNTFFFLFRVVQTLSHNFRNATRIVRVPLRLPIGSHQVLVKVIYAGVNASDVSSRFPKEFTLIYIFFFAHWLLFPDFNLLLKKDELFGSLCNQLRAAATTLLFDFYLDLLGWYRIHEMTDHKYNFCWSRLQFCPYWLGVLNYLLFSSLQRGFDKRKQLIHRTETTL